MEIPAEIIQQIESRASGTCMRCSGGEETTKCRVCGGTGFEFVSNSPRTVIPCRSCNGGHDQKVVEAMARADIPPGRSLSDFDWSVYGEDITRQRKIVEAFADRLTDFESEGLGLFITSRTRGSGKTFLASSIGGEVIERYEASARLVSASDLIEISKQKHDDGSDPLDSLIGCRVLILDDLGQKRTGQDWMSDILFRLIDARYRSQRVMILTSNVPVQELDLDDRLADRLNAMTLTINLPEFCVRAREANTRKRGFLDRLGIE